VTLENLLKRAYLRAEKNNKEVEAVKLLLMELTALDPSTFYLKFKEQVSQELIDRFESALFKYIDQNIPIQHIIGKAHFFGYPFFVNQDVLIPRPETEQLVEHVLSFYDQYYASQSISLLDIGTGSGCIAITISLEEKNINVTATDISQLALDVAIKNNNNLNASVDFKQSDLFKEVNQKFDIIVSNPPYIPIDEEVQKEVEKEPNIALYGGKTGLYFYESIIKQAKIFLKDDAFIAFEHGFNQSESIRNIAMAYMPDAKVLQFKDLAGKDRFTFIFQGAKFQ
jgi:release factor glutamine methyltransferase